MIATLIAKAAKNTRRLFNVVIHTFCGGEC